MAALNTPVTVTALQRPQQHLTALDNTGTCLRVDT